MPVAGSEYVKIDHRSVPTQRTHNSTSWSPGDSSMWTRRNETTNANPPSRIAKGDGLLGDTPSMLPPRPAILPRPDSKNRVGVNNSMNATWRIPGGLERRDWSVWVDHRPKVVNCEEMELESAQKTDISSISDFHALLSEIDLNVQGGCNIAVFTRGVKPTWEASQAHGKWVMLTDKRDTLPRLMLVLQAVLDGMHPNLRHVCGVVLSLRPARDCIAIWNTTTILPEQKGGDSHFIKTTRNILVQASQLPPTHKLNYFIIRPSGPQGRSKAGSGIDVGPMPACMSGSMTEGGGVKGRVRPAVGIDTDMDGLGRLKSAMARARSAASQGMSGMGASMPGVCGGRRDDSDDSMGEWLPYGNLGAAGHDSDEASARWMNEAGDESTTWPPQRGGGGGALRFAGCSPLLGVNGYNAFGSSSIWAPREGEAGSPATSAQGCLDNSDDCAPVRHIEALLMSSPSTPPDKNSPSQHEEQCGVVSSSPGGMTTTCIYAAAASSSQSWAPSPAVGQNPKFFCNDTMEGEEADVSESEGRDHARSRGNDAEKRQSEGRKQGGGDAEGEGDSGGEHDGEEDARVREYEDLREEDEERRDAEGMQGGDVRCGGGCDAVRAALEAAMDGDSLSSEITSEMMSARQGRELSRDLRVKMAMRSVLAAEKLVQKGVVGKKVRRKDKRSDHSSTESDARTSSSNTCKVHAKASRDSAGGMIEVTTCMQRVMWALCGAALTAGSALVFMWINADAVSPVSIM